MRCRHLGTECKAERRGVSGHRLRAGAVVVVGRGLRAQICVKGQMSPRFTRQATYAVSSPAPDILPHNRGNVVTFASNTTQIQTAILSRCEQTFLSLSQRDSLTLATLRRQRNIIKHADRRQKLKGCREEEGGGDVTRG